MSLFNWLNQLGWLTSLFDRKIYTIDMLLLDPIQIFCFKMAKIEN